MNAIKQYIHDRDEQVRKNMKDDLLALRTKYFTERIVQTNYTKSFTWMGIPILQYTSDLMVMQEIIWEVRPDWIIECGVAFGGMTAFYATILDFMGHGNVLGIDIEIREHTKKIHHPRIQFRQSSSTDETLLKEIRFLVKENSVLVSLDSNHTHAHVLKELELYAPLVSVGSYIVVFDTAIEFYGHLDVNQDRPWGKGNNPWTATQEFLKTEMGQNFVIDKEVEQWALISAAPDGWLRRIK